MSNWIAIPIKSLQEAKTRLSAILSPMERADLASSMFQDVLAASKRTPGVERVIVVTPAGPASVIARVEGIDLLLESKTDGLNKAVQLAIDHSSAGGCERLLVVHADVPLVEPEDLALFYERTSRIMISPSRDLNGTNALLLNPPNIIQPRYGRMSFDTHMRLAREKGIKPVVIKNERLALDIDTPQDLKILYGLLPRGKTGRFLEEHRIGERLKTRIWESATGMNLTS